MTDDRIDPATVTLNRSQLAQALRVSLPTIDKMVADGCPVESYGGNGKSYEFRLDRVKAWREERAAAAAADQAARDRLIQQELDLGGGTGERFAGYSPAEVKQALQNEYEAVRLGQLRGSLVNRDEVAGTFSGVLRTLSDQLQSLPDVLERTLNLNAADAELVQARVDDIQAAMHRAATEHLEAELAEAERTEAHAA